MTTQVLYVGTAGQDEFDVSFPFLSRTHVEVLVNGQPRAVAEWVSGSRLRIAAPLAGGESVVIRRNTPIDQALVQFQSGAVLTEEDLNTAVKQLLFKQQEISDLYNRSLSEAQQRLADNNGIVTDPNQVADELANLVLEQQVLDDFRARIADIDLNAQSILDQAFQLTGLNNAQNAVQTQVEALNASVDANVTRIDTTVGELRSDHDSLSATVDSLANIEGEGIVTLLQNEEQARIDGDEALAYTFSLVGARSDDNLAFILDLNKVMVGPTESFGQRLSAITSRADANEARIITEETTRATAIAAEATRIDALSAEVEGNEALIISEQNARAAGDNALASEINLIGARNAAGDAFILDLTTARVSSTESLGQRLSGISAEFGDVRGLITSEQTTRAATDNALATRIDSVEAEVDTNAAAILSEQTARANGDAAEAAARQVLRADVDDNAAAIASEQIARANGDAAEAAARTALAVRVDDNAAAIVSEQTARANGDAAEAAARTALAALVDDNEAAILSEQTARVNGDTAITEDLALLGARNAAGTAWVLDLNTALVDGTTSLGTRLSGIDTALGNNTAAIVNEQTARTTATEALATDISVLQTEVDGNTASVATLSSSINGLEARYGVSLDVNGYVTGFIQHNDGQSGTFTVRADRFSIVSNDGTSLVTPFTVTAAGVEINGNLVVDGSISSSQLAPQSVTQNASAYTAGSVSIPQETWTNVQNASITTEGGDVRVDFCGAFSSDNTEGGAVLYRIKRGSTVIRESTLVATPFPAQFIVTNESGVQSGSGQMPGYVAGTYSFFVMDTSAPAGSHTYTIQLYAQNGAGIAPAVSGRQLGLIELKR